jgi:GTP cyclohydrolase I
MNDMTQPHRMARALAPAGNGLAAIPDTQSERDQRHLAITRVGVRRLRYPLRVRAGHEAGQEVVSVVAEWSLAVALPAEKKGTHMSRFVAWLEDLQRLDGAVDAATLVAHTQELLQRLEAQEASIEARFPFFVRKQAPVSGVASLLDYRGGWQVEAGPAGVDVRSEVVVPVKSLCPCSKEISDYGAHNQRSEVTLRLQQLAPIPFGELVRFAEESASSEIWGLLKRPDEKWITERAYENPKFVEDLVRDVALRLNADPRVGRYEVEVENFESIHNHSAWARIVR